MLNKTKYFVFLIFTLLAISLPSFAMTNLVKKANKKINKKAKKHLVIGTTPYYNILIIGNLDLKDEAYKILFSEDSLKDSDSKYGLIKHNTSDLRDTAYFRDTISSKKQKKINIIITIL